jgi:hypothetical protein
MSAATASFRAGRLSEAGYMAQTEQFWRQLGVNPAGQQPAAPAGPSAPAPARPAARAPATAPAPAAPLAADDQAPWISQLRKLAQLHATACFPTPPIRPPSVASCNTTSTDQRERPLARWPVTSATFKLINLPFTQEQQPGNC